MRTADLVTALLLVAAGGVVLVDSLRLGAGWDSDGPQSGFFPFWLALLMVGAAALIALQAWKQTTTKPFATAAQLRPVAAVLGPAVAMVVIMELLGLYVASAVYLAFYMRWVGRHHWPIIVALAVGIPIVTFVVFERWFLVPMPKGPLEAWLGF
jgi:putative tricarboxylic transport membrane protein